MILRKRKEKRDEGNHISLVCENCGARMKRGKKAIIEFTGTGTPQLKQCVHCSNAMVFGGGNW